MSIHAQLSRMTTPHASAPAAVSAHPSEDAGVPLSEDRLQEIEQRAKAATAGPWVVGTDEPCENCGHWHAAEARWDHEVGDYGATLSRWHPEIDGCGNGGKQADAAFIAHARADVPALLAEVRRLRALASVSPVPAPTPDAEHEQNKWIVQKRAADRLGREVARLIARRIIDFRSPAADALLDYDEKLFATPQPPREDEIHPDSKDAARYRLLRALLRDVRWSDCTPALAVLRPDPDDAQTKYIDDVILDHALDAASHTRRLLVRQPEGQ